MHVTVPENPIFGSVAEFGRNTLVCGASRKCGAYPSLFSFETLDPVDQRGNIGLIDLPVRTEERATTGTGHLLLEFWIPFSLRFNVFDCRASGLADDQDARFG